MEHSGTALPTCDRILYYYGDFSVALAFVQTVRERGERNRVEAALFQGSTGNSKQKELRRYFRSPLKVIKGKALSLRKRVVLSMHRESQVIRRLCTHLHLFSLHENIVQK